MPQNRVESIWVMHGGEGCPYQRKDKIKVNKWQTGENVTIMKIFKSTLNP